MQEEANKKARGFNHPTVRYASILTRKRHAIEAREKQLITLKAELAHLEEIGYDGYIKEKQDE